jgi:uncharacterized protein YfbU (UPF0304 family)
MMSNLNLSEGERLILLMLCDLYKSMNLKCPIDPALFGPPLREGTGGASARPSTEAVADEVGAILDMWSAIERGYKHLSVDEKREVEAGAGPLGRGVRFSGFCADAEDPYCAAARALIEEAERFERFQGRNVVAHMPTLDGYRRMLRMFASMQPFTTGNRLGVRQIIDLANAEKYPG